jgi:hypothetical protein
MMTVIHNNVRRDRLQSFLQWLMHTTSLSSGVILK